MNHEDIVVGESYKVDNPTVKARDNKFTVTREPSHNEKYDTWEVDVVNSKEYQPGEGAITGAKVRVFNVDDLVEPSVKPKKEGPRTVTNKIVADLLDEIDGPWGDGISLHEVRVHFWPAYAKRGRKPGVKS